jgi:uncharacterized protein (TIGR03083 family)
VTNTPTFSELLSLIEDRATAFRAAARAAGPDFDARVPACPEWNVGELIAHVGEVHRSWAANVEVGGSKPASDEARGDVEPSGDLLDWSAKSTQILLDALRRAGPDKPCWTWWGFSASPQTVGAVARHQVQEAAVHAWDAQDSTGCAEPIRVDIAVDCIDEFLVVTLGAMREYVPWPHEPTRFRLEITEGSAWTVELSSEGATVGESADDVEATASGSASDLVLALYGRIPLDHLTVNGDLGVLERLFAWVNTE